jgi:diguanylate cyclase (GGDEF)-like protein
MLTPPPCDAPPSSRTDGPDELSRGDLAQLDVLRGVCLENVWGLLACCRLRSLAEGDCLLAAGHENHTLYMVLQGRFSVHLDAEMTEPVAFLMAGETVGELSVLDESPATAFVLAAEPSRVLAVDEETFWRMVAASHEFASNLLVLLAQRLRANNTSLSNAARVHRRLEREAMVDGLTGLHNRRWLDDRLPRLVQRCVRSRAPLSLLLIDIDHFKRFNDDFGHIAGDHVLSAVAQAMQRSVRPTDLVARYGGEEIVVILPDTPMDGARNAAERLRRQIECLVTVGPDERRLPPITITLGAALLRDDDTAKSLVDRADAAMYRGKRAGRNRVMDDEDV